MKIRIAVATVLSALALSACQQAPVVHLDSVVSDPGQEGLATEAPVERAPAKAAVKETVKQTVKQTAAPGPTQEAKPVATTEPTAAPTQEPTPPADCPAMNMSHGQTVAEPMPYGTKTRTSYTCTDGKVTKKTEANPVYDADRVAKDEAAQGPLGQ